MPRNAKASMHSTSRFLGSAAHSRDDLTSPVEAAKSHIGYESCLLLLDRGRSHVAACTTFCHDQHHSLSACGESKQPGEDVDQIPTYLCRTWPPSSVRIAGDIHSFASVAAAKGGGNRYILDHVEEIAANMLVIDSYWNFTRRGGRWPDLMSRTSSFLFTAQHT